MTRMRTLKVWMTSAALVMLVGSTALAFWAAPRLDAQLSAPAQPMSVTQAAYGMLGLAVVLTFIAGADFRAFPKAVPAGAVFIIVAGVSFGALLPWILVGRSI